MYKFINVNWYLKVFARDVLCVSSQSSRTHITILILFCFRCQHFFMFFVVQSMLFADIMKGNYDLFLEGKRFKKYKKKLLFIEPLPTPPPVPTPVACLLCPHLTLKILQSDWWLKFDGNFTGTRESWILITTSNTLGICIACTHARVHTHTAYHVVYQI